MEKDALLGTTGTETSVTYMNERFPDDIVYIVSHEIDQSNSETHILITDKELTDDRAYRIMQPNEVCMYDFSPEEITFNKLSSRYTKLMDENKTYDMKSSYFQQTGISDISENEAFLSMYVMLDTDKQTTDDYLIIRDNTKIYDELFTGDNDYSLYATDGENGKKINLNVRTQVSATQPAISVISKPFFCKGLVSLSQTFTIQVFENLKITPTRACIGTTATIAKLKI